MDKLFEINRLHNEYYSRTGVKPTRVYVGRDDFYDLRSTRDMCLYLWRGGETKTTIMGMDVFEVAASQHLFVC